MEIQIIQILTFPVDYRFNKEKQILLFQKIVNKPFGIFLINFNLLVLG